MFLNFKNLTEYPRNIWLFSIRYRLIEFWKFKNNKIRGKRNFVGLNGLSVVVWDLEGNSYFKVRIILRVLKILDACYFTLYNTLICKCLYSKCDVIHYSYQAAIDF